MTMMKHINPPGWNRLESRKQESGFTLIELMIAMVISFVLLLALASILTNVMRTNNEMARTNSQVENGRFAMQMLESDVEHGGFWGGYVPQFDNQTSSDTPALASAGGTVPTSVPDPCLTYASWTTEYKTNLIGIALQPVPTGNCTSIVAHQKASTDTLVVRHAAPCVAGSSANAGDCEATNTNKLYFQFSLCNANAQIGSTVSTIKLASGASSNNSAYTNATIRLTSGTGSGQTNTISSYDGSTKIATVSTNWTTTPDASTDYSFDSTDYVFDKPVAMTLHNRDCATASTLASATIASVRKFISHIYYIRDYSVTVGDGIPTLVRSNFDLSGTTPSHITADAMVEGIEGFDIEYGIDSLSETGAAVDYTAAVAWQDPTNQKTLTNRGDGKPDSYVHCTAASACTAYQLANVTAAKIYVLARSRETTPGYTDTKTYQLGSTTLGPFNDGYKRHVFETTVRLSNVAGRRETP
jgi:prepilin-type N-terminal cleavage/methylation domain-containing protein